MTVVLSRTAAGSYSEGAIDRRNSVNGACVYNIRNNDISGYSTGDSDENGKSGSGNNSYSGSGGNDDDGGSNSNRRRSISRTGAVIANNSRICLMICPAMQKERP